MWIKFETSQQAKDTIVLLHGLGDHSGKFNALAKLLLQQNYNVLRVDLHGHGYSLQARWKKLEEIPIRIDYHESVEDITTLIQTLNIRNPILIGHSYGAAIAYAVAAKLQTNTPSTAPAEPGAIASKLQAKQRARSTPQSKKPKKLIMLTPYVQRLDTFKIESQAQNILELQYQNLRAMGFPPSVARMMMSPFQLSLDVIKFWRDQWDIFSVDDIQDFYRDPFITDYLQSTYAKYIREDTPPEQRHQIELQARAAVAATKGIRDFDLLHSNGKVDLGIPIILLGAEKDAIVPDLQLKEMARKLEREGATFYFEVLPGLDHHFPKEKPYLLLDWLN